jgi:hypothetical protein
MAGHLFLLGQPAMVGLKQQHHPIAPALQEFLTVQLAEAHTGVGHQEFLALAGM